MMDGCDEKYNIHNTSNPSNCDGQIAPKKKGMKRYAKKYYITKNPTGMDERICPKKIEETSSNWDGRMDMPPKKEKHHPIGMDRYAKKYYMRKKHPIRTETDMTRKYYIRTIQSGWTDTTKYYIRNIRRI
jgi:hypothetical protein